MVVEFRVGESRFGDHVEVPGLPRRGVVFEDLDCPGSGPRRPNGLLVASGVYLTDPDGSLSKSISHLRVVDAEPLGVA
jgi:hypothetical protein